MTRQKPNRLLIIRFSSFGDIAQCMIAAQSFRELHPDGEVHWAVRSEFKDFIALHVSVTKVWPLWRREGFKGLWSLGRRLKAENFSHVYDAHSNLRSHLLSLMLLASPWFKFKNSPSFFVRRSKRRWDRLLFFKFGINRFPTPYRAMESYIYPVRLWNLQFPKIPVPFQIPKDVQEKCDALIANLSGFIVLAPSAAWEMKRWPEMHWREFISRITYPIVLLGGPEDAFIENLYDQTHAYPIINLAGKCTLVDSAYLISRANTVVSADTGTLHVADLLGVPALALLGPTAFGFPSRPTSRVVDIPLWCRPCTKDGRGKCINPVYQRCMKEITPVQVITALQLSYQPKLTLSSQTSQFKQDS